MPTKKTVKRSPKSTVSRSLLVDALAKFRQKRLDAEELKKSIPLDQEELIQSLRQFDPDNKGVVWDEEDPNKGAAYVQQNDGSLVWVTEDIIDWLRKPENKKLWMACSSRVFDVNKFEAEIAAGNISKKLAKKFQTETDPPKPFVRFGKINKGENL